MVILLAGLLFGTIVPALCILLTRRWIAGKAGALAIGLVATFASTYLALQLSFRVAEHVVMTQVVPQWKAQGHFDNGPSAFVAIGTLAMPFIFGALFGGMIATVILVARRRPK
jgi:hypothetical protein